MEKSSKTKENIEILRDKVFKDPKTKMKALNNLGTLGTPEAIKEIGNRAKDVLEDKEIVERAKELLKMVLAGELAHGGNPVLRWCMDNLVVQTDAAENFKPAKDKARERIDGAVVLIMALGRALLLNDPKSVYEDRGVITV